MHFEDGRLFHRVLDWCCSMRTRIEAWLDVSVKLCHGNHYEAHKAGIVANTLWNASGAKGMVK
eukprot:6309193-Amphidinium_carterae.1